MNTAIPVRRSATRTSLPDSKGGHPQRVLPSKLRPVEQTLFILMSDPGRWYLVDEFRGSSATASPMRQALWRRGAEVRQRKWEMDQGVIQVWARWTWDVPDRVAPWEVVL